MIGGNARIRALRLVELTGSKMAADRLSSPLSSHIILPALCRARHRGSGQATELGLTRDQHTNSNITYNYNIMPQRH